MTPVDAVAARAAIRAASNDVLAYLARRVASPEDAADLYGEVLLTAWKKLTTMPESPERQRMWLFVIAANTLRNHRRSSARRLELTERLRHHVAAATPAPEHDYAVRDAVARLPVAQRELVRLIHWDGFTIVEAAELLAVNPSTARSRYAAARELLRHALVDEPA